LVCGSCHRNHHRGKLRIQGTGGRRATPSRRPRGRGRPQVHRAAARSAPETGRRTPHRRVAESPTRWLAERGARTAVEHRREGRASR
jgi:hypothetical protein